MDAMRTALNAIERIDGEADVVVRMLADDVASEHGADAGEMVRERLEALRERIAVEKALVLARFLLLGRS